MQENTLLLRFFLLAILLGIAGQSYAAHLIGGEITYRCLGFTNNDPATNSNTYEFTINVYRDCQSGGSEFDSPTFVVNMHVTVYQGNNEYGTFYLEAPTIEEIDIAENINNPCIIVPDNVCVESGTYIFTLDLPIVSQAYNVVYQRCCRNNTITNILNPESSGTTYNMELTPQAQLLCNSSPTFTEYPPAILCAGQPFSYDFSAVDAEGDQLVYEFCSPFLGGGNSGGQGDPNGVAPDPDLPFPYNNVTFLAPTYTVSRPLGATANLEVNSATGLMTGQPQFTGQFVVGVCVSEFRNGVLLSTVRRDFQFNVTTCEVTVFAGIRGDSLTAGGDFIVSSCGDTQVNFVNESGLLANINAYRWEFEIDGQAVVGTTRDFSYNFPGVGTYEGLMVVNPTSTVCRDTARVLVNIFPELTSDFTFAYDTCVAQPVVFSNLSTTAGGQAIVSNQWRYGDGAAEDLVANSHQYAIPGSFVVELGIVDENGCTNSSTQTVNYFPVPNLIVIAPSDYRGCVPAEIFFDNLSFPVDNSYTFDWEFGDGGTGSDLSPTYLYESPGSFSVSLAITSPIGCTTDTVFNDLIFMEPAPTSGFSFSPTMLTNFAAEVQVTDEARDTYRWFYDFNGEATSLQPNPSYVFADTGLAYITQVVTHPSGCIDSLTQYVDVKPEITFFFPNAFSPNGDGLNDEFRPKGFTRGGKQFQMQIWNRWGEPVFSSADPFVGWNGRKGNTGRDEFTGIYLYEAMMLGPRGEPLNYKGFVTLIR